MLTVTRMTPSDFERFGAEWTDLLKRASCRSPMLTWEWMFSWWETYRSAEVQRDLCLLALRDGERLVGLAPLVRRPWQCFGLTMRRIEFMGTGEAEEDETCSEYLDVIAEAGREQDVAAALAAHLRADAEWDEIALLDVRADSETTAARLAKAIGGRGLSVKPFGQARCPFIKLPDTWDAYVQTLSRNSRRLLRYKRKLIVSEVRIDFDMAGSPEWVNEVYGQFMDLHQHRWGDDSGCFRSPYFTEFLDRVTARLQKREDVVIAQLMLDEEPASIYYLLRQGDALYYYNSGADLRHFNRYSPGSVCLGFVIEYAIREGFKELHFFKGGSGSYKYHWTEQSVPVVSYRAQRPGWKQTACTVIASGRAVMGRIKRAIAAWRRARQQDEP